MKVVSILAMAALMMAAGAVAAKEKQRSSLEGWLGEWAASEEQFITIAEEGDGLLILGNASWGAGDPDRVARGGVNIGEFSANVPASWVKKGRIGFAVGMEATLPLDQGDEYDCSVELRLVGDVIEAEDNLMCGGMNVTFSGEYRQLE